MASALSLECQDCGTQLRSVAEAQTHGEMTGHANFAESTKAVLQLVCAACAKPCRSEHERDLHARRTGHAEFTDMTSAQEAKAINTQAEFSVMEKEMLEDAGLPVPAADADTADGAGAKEGGQDEEAEMVEPKVDETLLAGLLSMDFPRHRAVRAIHFSGGGSLDAAVNWVLEHGEDADIDTPLLVPKASETTATLHLDPAEAKRQAKELVERARQKKAREEKLMEVEREKERIRSGKELVETKRKLAEAERKRAYDLRRREKEEDAKARAAIKARLEEDRRERRIKLGLPPEETPQEKAEKEAKAAAAAEKKAPAARPSRQAPAIGAQFREILVRLKQAHKADEATVQRAFKTLGLYCSNVLRAPSEEKFRKINLANEAFQARVGNLTGGVEFLEAVGFQRDNATKTLFMPEDKVDSALLTAACTEITSAVTNPFFGTL